MTQATLSPTTTTTCPKRWKAHWPCSDATAPCASAPQNPQSGASLNDVGSRARCQGWVHHRASLFRNRATLAPSHVITTKEASVSSTIWPPPGLSVHHLGVGVAQSSSEHQRARTQRNMTDWHPNIGIASKKMQETAPSRLPGCRGKQLAKF